MATSNSLYNGHFHHTGVRLGPGTKHMYDGFHLMNLILALYSYKVSFLSCLSLETKLTIQVTVANKSIQVSSALQFMIHALH